MSFEPKPPWGSPGYTLSLVRWWAMNSSRAIRPNICSSKHQYNGMRARVPTFGSSLIELSSRRFLCVFVFVFVLVFVFVVH